MFEYWDLYDENKNKLDKVVKRGDKLNDNEYHLVVNVWIKNENNRYLISQRSENKKHPLLWECTGGSAIKNESSIDAAIREAKEELGIELNKLEGKLIGSKRRYYPGCPDILDAWIFKYNDISTSEIKIQKEEVNDVKWASVEEIRKLYVENKFESNDFFEEALRYEI